MTTPPKAAASPAASPAAKRAKSAARTAANRQNAKKSTGPATAKGKQRSSQNARKHGLLSRLAVVPGLEREDDWKAHRRAVLDDLAPVGYLELMLAERVASLLWRLARANRAERDTIVADQDDAERDVAREAQHDEAWRRVRSAAGSASGAGAVPLAPEIRPELTVLYRPQNLNEQAEYRKEIYYLLVRFAGLEDDAPLDGEDAVAVLTEVAEQAGLGTGVAVMAEVERLPLDAVPDEVPLAAYREWTAGLVRHGIGLIADRTNKKAALVLEVAIEAAGAASQKETVRAIHAERELQRRQRRRVLPVPATLQNIARYEASLERSLYRTLHELERRKAARAGVHAIAPVAVDVAVHAVG